MTSSAHPAQQAAAASKLKIVVLQGEGTIHRLDRRAPLAGPWRVGAGGSYSKGYPPGGCDALSPRP